MTRRLEIDLYLPPEPLWPNARPHRALKWRQTRQYRTDCGLIALAAANACDWGLPAQVATLAATFHLDGRRRDPDNCLAAIKAAIDSLKDSRIISDDRHLRIATPTILTRREWVAAGIHRPGVIFLITAD